MRRISNGCGPPPPSSSASTRTGRHAPAPHRLPRHRLGVQLPMAAWYATSTASSRQTQRIHRWYSRGMAAPRDRVRIPARTQPPPPPGAAPRFESKGAHVVPDDEDTPFESLIDEVERRLRRTRSWGSTVMWVTSVLAAVFSGGMAWAVFVGENTTDAEMHHEIRQAFTRHNGGVDPEKLDDVTNAPVGHHPDMRKAIRQQEEGLRELRNTVLPRIEESQRKLEKR